MIVNGELIGAASNVYFTQFPRRAQSAALAKKKLVLADPKVGKRPWADEFAVAL
jgi:hypothetical protein